jgi:ribosomal protein L37E
MTLEKTPPHPADNLPLDQIICGDNCEVMIRDELHCRKCGCVWSHTTGKTRAKCPECGKGKDARIRTYKKTIEQTSGWKNLNGERRKEYTRNSRAIQRRKVLFRISGTSKFSCVRCGCDDARLLEINHKDGGGNKEMQKGKRSNEFYRSIASGDRTIDDLELLCKPCNAIHALELKYGKLLMKVVWNV